MINCLRCEDTGWVCENHPNQPWQGPHACTCGGAGAPCPVCLSQIKSGYIGDAACRGLGGKEYALPS
jgi:hypothetical protein